MRGQMAMDIILAVLVLLMMFGVYTAFVDRGSMEVRRGLHYVICDLAGTKFARVESLLRLSGMGNAPGKVDTLRLTSGKGDISPAEINVVYNNSNVEVNVAYTGTTIICLGREVPRWQ